MNINKCVFLALTSFTLIASPLFPASAQLRVLLSAGNEEQKRSAALTKTLYDEAMLPPELIHIIDEYDKGVVVRTNSEVLSLVVLPSRGFATCGAVDGSIDIFDHTGSRLKVLKGHQKPVCSMVMLGANRLVSGSVDCTAKVWDLDSGSCLQTLVGHTNTIWSVVCISEQCVATGSDGGKINIWDTQTGAVVNQFKAEPASWLTDDRFHYIRALTLLPQSQQLVSAGYRGFIKIWDLRQHPRRGNEGLIRSFSDAWGPVALGVVNALVALPNGLFASGWDDGYIRIFDQSGKRAMLLDEHTKGVCSLVLLSPTLLASGSEDRTIKIWDITKKSKQCIQTLVGHAASVIALAKVDEHTLLSASSDGTIRRWDLEKVA